MPSAPVCVIRTKIVAGYLSGKMFEKALAAKGFEPPWGKRKAPAFVSKAGTYYGAPGGIRTHGLPLRRRKKCSPSLPANVPQVLDIIGFLTISGRSHFLPKPPLLP